MNEHLNSFLTISTRSIGKGMVIIVGGLILSITCLIVGLFMLFSADINVGQAGNAGAIGALPLAMQFLREQPVGFLTLISGFVTPVVYLLMGRNMMIKNVLASLWGSEGKAYLLPVVKKMTEQIVKKMGQPHLSKVSEVREALLKQNKRSAETTGIKRRVLKYMYKRLPVTDELLQANRESWPALITNQASDYIEDFVKPSWAYPLVLMFIQFVLMIFSLIGF